MQKPSNTIRWNIVVILGSAAWEEEAVWSCCKWQVNDLPLLDFTSDSKKTEIIPNIFKNLPPVKIQYCMENHIKQYLIFVKPSPSWAKRNLNRHLSGQDNSPELEETKHGRKHALLRGSRRSAHILRGSLRSFEVGSGQWKRELGPGGGGVSNWYGD